MLKIIYFFALCVFLLNPSISNAKENIDTNNDRPIQSGFLDILDKKNPFYTLTIGDDDYTVNPYFGLGYAFSIASYKDSSQQYSSKIPNMFHDILMMAGVEIDSTILVELTGFAGFNSYQNGNSANLNSLHLNVGYVFGENILGSYGDKNKIIVLAGIAFGFSNASISGVGDVAQNYFSVAPELGIAYQRYIFDRLSVRVDARVNSLKVYDSSGSIMGLFTGSVIFHL